MSVIRFEKNNIKEVLLFPAMKPDETAAPQSTSRGLGMPPAPPTAAASAAAVASYPPVFASGSSVLKDVDLASAAGIQKLEVRMRQRRVIVSTCTFQSVAALTFPSLIVV